MEGGGGSERRHMYSKDITHRIIDGEKRKMVDIKDRQEYTASRTMRLNSEILQYAGITPGQRVFGGSPKLPIGAVDNPTFKDCVATNETPVVQTHRALVNFRGVRKRLYREIPMEILFGLKHQFQRTEKRAITRANFFLLSNSNSKN